MASLNPDSSIPPPSQAHMERGYGVGATSRPQPSTVSTDLAPAHSHSLEASPGSQAGRGRFNEEWDASQRGSSIIDGPSHRSTPATTVGDSMATPSRGGTLKKKASLRRSSSRRSSRAGSVRSLALQSGGDTDETYSAFYSPVPTSGNPTEVLANRFQAWRKVLKDLITYFKEIQGHYEQRSKSLLKVSNVINNTVPPGLFLQSGGINDALQVLRNYHKASIAESNKSRDIENDVILALVGLRSDLQQKIKEIKNLSGDFKNSVDKEMENTRKAVNALQEALGQATVDTSQQTGKQDPYLLKLAVDRQIERQLDEENYLHQAYLNLEASGRELESIVVGEIQKSYNAYAGILKREADAAYNAVEELRTGPIAMPKDFEWSSFVEKDSQLVDPRVPIRLPQHIHYPGKNSELAQEVRAGLMERKSKYLKSYTAGWYVLSPTHLHEFKSADKQVPVMSLYLPEQKLGSHSSEGGSSNKFSLKGRQTGSMHRGHAWVFRCESHDTMMAWYEDIKALTEKSPQERSTFVRQHARSFSGTSQNGSSVSSGDFDEEDEEPFSGANSEVVSQTPKQDTLPRRPQPGGRFPSERSIPTQRGLQAPLSPSSGSSSLVDLHEHSTAAAAAALPGSGIGHHYGADAASPTHAEMVNQSAMEDGVNPYTNQPIYAKNNEAGRSLSRQNSAAKHPSSRDAVPFLGAAGALGAVGYEAHHVEEKKAQAPSAYQEPTRTASYEASPIVTSQQYSQLPAQQVDPATIIAPVASQPPAASAPHAQQLRRQADIESAAVAAPDIDVLPTATAAVMSGGHSLGESSGVKTPLVSGAQVVRDHSQTTADPIADETPATKPAVGGEAAEERPHLAGRVNTGNIHLPGEYPPSLVDGKGPAGAHDGGA